MEALTLLSTWGLLWSSTPENFILLDLLLACSDYQLRHWIESIRLCCHFFVPLQGTWLMIFLSFWMLRFDNLVLNWFTNVVPLFMGLSRRKYFIIMLLKKKRNIMSIPNALHCCYLIILKTLISFSLMPRIKEIRNTAVKKDNIICPKKGIWFSCWSVRYFCIH